MAICHFSLRDMCEFSTEWGNNFISNEKDLIFRVEAKEANPLCDIFPQSHISTNAF